MQIRITAQHLSDLRGSAVRRGEPVTFGVSLPRGRVQKASAWTLMDESGRHGHAETRAVDVWPDGSVRWMLVDGRLNVATDRENLVLTDEADAPKVERPIVCLEQPNGVVVDTGAARFEILSGGAVPFAGVVVPGSNRPVLTHLSVTDGNGTELSAVLEHVELETRGALRAVVRADGNLVRNAAPVLAITVRAHFYAGLATARLLVTVTNPEAATHPGGFWDLGDPKSVLLKDLSVVVASRGGTPRIMCSPEQESALRAFDRPFEIYQDSSGGEAWQSLNHVNRDRHVPNTFRGYRLRGGESSERGLRATPVVEVASESGVVAAAIPDFWQNFPRAVEVDGSGALTVRLWPGQYGDQHEIQPGEQKTHELYLAFAADDVTDVPLDWCRNRTVVAVDPAWTLSANAIGFFEALSADHASLVQSAIEGDERFDRKREVIDEYGWRHFGEIYGDHESVRQKQSPLVSHYNNQYDPLAGFILQFLRTGDRRWWRMAVELASHVVDIDVYHTTRDKSAYNHGLFWHTYHYGDADTATHRTYPKSAHGKIHGGGPSADHNYTTGLMLYYFLTGDEAARQTVIDLGQFVIDMDDGRKTVLKWIDRGDTGRAALSATGYFGPGRGPANSLNALVDAHRISGDRRFLDKAERLIRRVIHPSEDIATRRLEVPELRWFYTMFLQSLGKYLHDKAERGQADAMYAYGRDSLLHYARWMAANEHPYLERPEKLEFPTETWAAQDIRKSDVFSHAALHAAGDERARFLERAGFYHDYSTKTLGSMPTRRLARPVIVLLTSGLMHGWMRTHADAVMPRPAGSDHGRPETFVPQMTRAKQRLVKVVAAGGVTFVTLLALWFLR